MREEDAELFRQAMQGVRPLKGTKRAFLQPEKRRHRRGSIPSPAPDPTPSAPATAAQGQWERCGERVFWQRDGLRPQEITRLKKGQFAKHWSIDLHGMTRDRAEAEVRRFLHQAWQLGARHALIIHGKGYNSESGPVLREMVHDLLPTLPFVLAFSSAQPRDGDTGATYAFLKAHASDGSP